MSLRKRAARFNRKKNFEGFGVLRRSIDSKQLLEQFWSTHTLTDMVSRRTILSPLLRSFAAATLLVWLAVLAFCSADCLIGDSHCQPSRHDEQAASSHHDDDQTPESDKHDSGNDSVCNSLKTLVPTANNNALFKPDFGFSILSFVSLPQALAVAESGTPISRQARAPDCVFTPELRLGPAFRSHAPPLAV